MRITSTSSGRRFLTVGEAADLLCCCQKTVRRRIKAGELRCVRNGRRVLVPVAAIDEFLGLDAV